jgi:hypothetical protein
MGDQGGRQGIADDATGGVCPVKGAKEVNVSPSPETRTRAEITTVQGRLVIFLVSDWSRKDGFICRDMIVVGVSVLCTGQ